MRYLFILGRNPELSLAELKAVFEKNQILQNKNSALIETEEILEAGFIDKLGGTIAIGQIIASGKGTELLRDLDKKEIYFSENSKFNYAIWNFSEFCDELEKYLKQRFKNERLKAIEKKLTGRIQMQNKDTELFLASKLINEEYFIFENKTSKENYFGKIIQKCDYKKLEERDMNKPVRREELSISPRLAKIMINLSQVKENQTLVDPFCGIGTILQEALLQNIKVIGIDKDSTAIKDAKKNIEWLGLKNKEYNLIANDSAKVSISKANAIATEPSLGELLKKTTPKEKAEQMQRKFEDLVSSILKNLENKISGKIVFTAPLIKVPGRRISCNINNILNKTHLKLEKGFPIPEFRENQIVGREIFVLKH